MGSAGAYLVGPHPEARQCVGAERGADSDVGGVAAARDQYPADARRVVAGVERVPAAVEEDLEPRGEIHWTIWRRHSHVAEVARRGARGGIHAPAAGKR